MKKCPPVVLYRISNYLYYKKAKIISKVIDYINRVLFSVWLPGSARIGKNFVIGYWGLGIVIHSKAIIEDNVWISQNVTIGRKEYDQNVPMIKNSTYIGPNSVVVGEISIGPNSVIGANSFVNKNVPPNTVVAGCPARFIKTLKNGEVYKRIQT